LFAAAPDANAVAAISAPSRNDGAIFAATSAAAAFTTTMSRWAPVSPAKIARSMVAFSAGSPPREIFTLHASLLLIVGYAKFNLGLSPWASALRLERAAV
jgi:hypothetical protein